MGEALGKGCHGWWGSEEGRCLMLLPLARNGGPSDAVGPASQRFSDTHGVHILLLSHKGA